MVSLFHNEHRRLSDLARAMKQGDSRAAENLYTYLFPKVFGYCMARLKNKARAEDVTQEIFLKLVEKIETWTEGKGNFLSWFWAVARNALIDSYRERSNEQLDTTEDDPIANLPSHDNIEESLDLKQRLTKVYAFLETLDRNEQELFEFRFIAELSYDEIASVTGKTSGALRVAISRLKNKIESHFNLINNARPRS